MKLKSLLVPLRTLFLPTEQARQQAGDLVTTHGPRRAWLISRDRGRMARVVDAEAESHYWSAVTREIERQTGYVHQADTAVEIESTEQNR